VTVGTIAAPACAQGTTNEPRGVVLARSGGVRVAFPVRICGWKDMALMRAADDWTKER
jgi:hypothetical protein